MDRKLDYYLDGVSSVAISGHLRPDGDCVGSTLACYNYIKDNYPKVTVVVYLDPMQDVFEFLPGAKNILHDRYYEEPFDLFIALDCADIDRLGKSRACFDDARHTLCIDHHVSNKGFADENIIEPSWSSACEVLFTLLMENKISKNCAICLYNGIVHDTGIFQYACTSRQTMNIAGKLMGYGFDFTKLVDSTFFAKTYEQNRVMGKVLLDSRLYFDGRLIVSVLSREQMNEFEVDGRDLEGIVNQLRVTRGVLVAAFLHEIEGGYRVSMRSNGPDVSAVAVKFEGGGHVRAAGCSLGRDIDTELPKLLNQIHMVISDYNG